MKISKKLGFGNILRSALAAGLLYSYGCGDIHDHNSLQEFIPQIICPSKPDIEDIAKQSVMMGDSLNVKLNIKDLSTDDKVYLNGPTGMALKNGQNGLEIEWRPCGDSTYTSRDSISVSARNKCWETDTEIFYVNVLPKDNPIFFLEPVSDIDMQIGDSVSIPLNIYNNADINAVVSLEEAPSWATLRMQELHLNPHTAYDGNIKIKVTSDGCYSESQNPRVKVNPINIDGILYDYYKKLKVEDENGNKEDGYYLAREVNYGLNDQKLDSMVKDIEKAISWNYTITGSSSAVKPILIHLNDDSTCISNGRIGFYRHKNICGSTWSIENPYKIIGHEDIHARFTGTGNFKIPNEHNDYSDARLQEPWAYVISYAGVNNHNKLNEFPEICKTYTYYKFILNLFENYGENGLNIDVREFRNIFKLIDEKTDYGNTFMTPVTYKCKVLDNYFKTDTSSVYCDNFTCTDTYLYPRYDIPKEYCGD